MAYNWKNGCIKSIIKNKLLEVKKIRLYYRRYQTSTVATIYSKVLSIIGFILCVISIICLINFSSNLIVGFLGILGVLILILLGTTGKTVESYLANRFKDEAPCKVPDITEAEYLQAQRIVEFGKRHPAVKEIAALKKATPSQVIEYYEDVIRFYNMKH